MNRTDDTSDLQFDRNLRALAPHVALPRAATRLQRANWKRPRDPADRAAARPAPRRAWRWGAIAAGLAMPLLVLTLPRQNVIAADTILESLQRSCADGALLTFHDLGADGIRFSGRAIYLSRPPVDPERGGAASSPGGSLKIELELAAAPATPDIGGFRGRIWLSDQHGAQWFYLRADALPSALMANEPWMAIAARALREGVMVRTDSLFAGLAEGIGSLPVLSDLASGLPGPARPPTPQSPDDLSDLLDQFLLPMRDSEEFARLIASLERSARSLRVERHADGIHTLSASDFRGAAGAAAASGRGLEFHVRFVEGRGVEWAELRHVGAYDGTISLVPLTAASSIPPFEMPQAGIVLDGRR